MKIVPIRYIVELNPFACEIAIAEWSGWVSLRKVTELLMTVVIPKPAIAAAVMVSNGRSRVAIATTPRRKTVIPIQDVVNRPNRWTIRALS